MREYFAEKPRLPDMLRAKVGPHLERSDDASAAGAPQSHLRGITIMAAETPDVPSTNKFTNFLKRSWLAIVLFVVAIVIAVQNALSDEQSTILLLWGRITLPSWLLIVVVLLIGCVAGWIVARGRSRRRKR